MSSEPQTWADLQNTGNAQSQLLLQAIARHADWDTGECHVRYERLGRMGKCSTKTVQRHIRQMESDGFIERIARARDDGSQGANTLRLVGYADWITANRIGGKVDAPRRAPKRCDGQVDAPDDAPPTCPNTNKMAPDNLSGGGVDGEPENGSDRERPNKKAPDNVTGAPDRLTGGPGHLVSGVNEPSTELDTPLPPKGGLAQKLLEWARCSRSVEHLLIPLLDDQVFTARPRLSDLQTVAHETNALPVPHLVRVGEMVRETGKRTRQTRDGATKPARVDVEAVMAAVAAVRKGGLCLPISRHEHPEQWQAWLTHFEHEGGVAARMMRANTRWQVPDRWPPGHASHRHQTGDAA